MIFDDAVADDIEKISDVYLTAFEKAGSTFFGNALTDMRKN